MTIGNQPTWKNNIEKALDPKLPICDPHHHFWERPDSTYMPDELLADAGSGHNIVSTVFLECGSGYRTWGPKALKPVGETRFVRRLVPPAGEDKTAFAAGIVGYANLALGEEVDAVLEAHLAAGKGNFRGIRMTAAWDPHPEFQHRTSPPPGILMDPMVRKGFARLKKYSLSFDAWLYFHQMTELVDLARAFPDTSIVLNHVGGPLTAGPYAARKEEVWADWRRGITALAACPNVVVKIGGLGMPRCGFGWHARKTPVGSEELAADTSPYYLFCIDRFGTKRCMFESNFPVDKVSYSYSVVWNSFKRIAVGFSPDEKADLFHDTAVRVYRLSQPWSDVR